MIRMGVYIGSLFRGEWKIDFEPAPTQTFAFSSAEPESTLFQFFENIKQSSLVFILFEQIVIDI